METSSRSARFRGERRTTFQSNFELPSPSSYNSKKERQRKEDPSAWTLVWVILFTLIVFAFIRYVDFRLPTPLTSNDVAENPKSFIEERARHDLIILTSVGPRVAGSHANDIATIDTLTRILKEIQRTKVSDHNIEFEVEKPVGSFHIGFQDGLTSSYANIPNFVVKLSPANRKEKVTNDSILVNCHIDSVPGSPGASDDMASCAVMLETIRVLSRDPTPLRNTIIFLFNGAEENLMQGSHGFIKGKTEGSSNVGHRWTKDLKCFLNLESAGAGAREILFQTGPGNGWLVESYTKVPYPWGSVVGEEIFQSGLIPSDTDFRIFRDFANIPGLDMAFVKNGYVYHTKFDDVNHVTPGSLQHEGSNVLSLLQSLGNLDFSKIEYNSEAKMVFFDVFGFFMVAYSASTAMILNIIVGLVVLVIAWIEAGRNVRTMSWHVFTTFSAWIGGMASSLMFGLWLNFFQIYSPYHSYPMSVFLIFGIPCLVTQVMVYSLALKGTEDCTWIATKTSLAVSLILSTFFTRIVFSITFNLIFGIIGWYVARIMFKDVSSLGYKLRLGFYLIVGEAFPMALSLYLVAGCIDTFVPIMGRSGSDSNPNLFLAVLTSFTLTIPTITGIVPIFVFFKKAFLRISAVVMLVLILVLVFVVGRVPYGEKTPMRIHLIEVDRTYYEADLTTIKKRDAGLWLFNVDPNIPKLFDELGENIPELKHENHVEIDAYNCEDLYCGLPFVFPVKKLIRRSHWIPKEISLPESMTSSSKVRMEITQDAFITGDVRRVTFSFVGPDHLTINFSPGLNFDIVKWSLTDKVPSPMSVLWKGRPTYFVYHARGIAFERFNVTVDFRKNSASSTTDHSLVDINFSSFYLHGDEMKSKDMLHFIDRLPSWTYVLGFTGVSHLYSVPA